MRLHASVTLVPILLFCSCASGDSSLTLSLSLAPGMERKMRFTTEQHIDAAGLAGASSVAIAFTYRFRVASVSSSGTAKVVSSVLDASVSGGIPGADAYVDSLHRQSFAATIDSRGHVLDLRSEHPAAVAAEGFPLAPGALAQNAPAQGDMDVLFGGLNGKRVTIGDTWTSALAQGRGSGIRGNLRWTLASVRGSTARLEYTGMLEEQRVPIDDLPADAQAILAGDASGFVELEKDTGWPRRGTMVIRASVVTLRDPGASAGAAPVPVSIRIVTRFDTVP
jgi:hypothetical protein